MSNSQAHIVEPKTYYTVFVILLVLLVATVLAAQIPHPVINVVIAITIATTKAVLIVLYFMHVRHSTPFVRVIVVAGIGWLLLLIVFTLSDYSTRGWDRETGDVVDTVSLAQQGEDLAEHSEVVASRSPASVSGAC